ncbi:hypothetical protein SNL152K_737 [Streptomyces sp. NL15-2K]|nr:hypothetical protein SNL152K_737 [Streptomyces sp. NL15-2K]
MFHSSPTQVKAALPGRSSLLDRLRGMRRWDALASRVPASRRPRGGVAAVECVMPLDALYFVS